MTKEAKEDGGNLSWFVSVVASSRNLLPPTWSNSLVSKSIFEQSTSNVTTIESRVREQWGQTVAKGTGGVRVMHIILLCSLSVCCGLCCVLCYNMSDAAPKKDFMWSTKDTSSSSILGSDHLTKLLVRHHYRLRRKCRNPTVATGTVRYGTVQYSAQPP